jgi:hypothetical protein
MDENGRASLELANNNRAVDTNCANAHFSVHALTMLFSVRLVKFVENDENYSLKKCIFLSGIPQMGDVQPKILT